MRLFFSPLHAVCLIVFAQSTAQKMSIVHRGTRRGRILALNALFLPFLCSNASPYRPFHSRNLALANDSFIQSYANNGSLIITANPVEHAQVNDPYFEDNLHVIIACSVALLLVTLMGLFIRYHGLTLPSTNSQLQHTPSTDTGEKRGVFGLGFSRLESPGSVKVPPAARVK